MEREQCRPCALPALASLHRVESPQSHGLRVNNPQPNSIFCPRWPCSLTKRVSKARIHLTTSDWQDIGIHEGFDSIDAPPVVFNVLTLPPCNRPFNGSDALPPQDPPVCLDSSFSLNHGTAPSIRKPFKNHSGLRSRNHRAGSANGSPVLHTGNQWTRSVCSDVHRRYPWSQFGRAWRVES